MPELPEVETIKTAISESVGNGRIKKVNIRNRKFKEPIPLDFENVVSGAKIISFKRIAKYIVIELDNGNSIIWHLGMSGRIKILDSMPEELEKHDHIIIELDNKTLIYNDARRFGLITHCKTKDLKSHKLLSKIGLDPFDENLTAEYLYKNLKTKKNPIKTALLDQTIINGIGNIYASEILFLAGISPLRLSNAITKKESQKIIEATIEVLKKAIKAGGSTLKDYRKPDGGIGYFQNSHCVYNKTGQKCCNCTCDTSKTGGIKKITQAGRSTFYCPVKQN
ncbi:MAG: bifunctional DNA-formamidopyrimidine glycosylase/DNA-(apurinic or apyrimidinic site) lyase [Lactobacillaceae bacterium]|jgi:formamidopyrimidine-DNA glycosylase|nr:bifunctional DNA-formamidopyrimidine glycosylase/DNA-(apurinic or apyrimidinic site) lyase [Lactobacillaceae bacterium]